MSASARELPPQQGGDARSEGVAYQGLLDRDTREVPEVLREVHCPELGSADIPAELFTSQAVHDLEMDRMWRRVWQMACREEEIPEVGDHVVYEIGHLSFIVVRTDAGYRAFYNSCLHRGRQLRDEDGSVSEFRCPFHGFTWNLDGTLKEIPCRWDFPHLNEDNTRLPEVRVDTWGGFVFINLDEQAPPLHEYLGILPQHFERWPLEQTWKAVHVQKIVRANWKVVMEAFIESWHSVETHPQILPYTADSNSQYDWWGDNISRTITAMGSPSPHLRDVAEQEIMTALARTSGRMSGTEEDDSLKVPEGKSAREHMADVNRAEFGRLFGIDLTDASDAEVLDAILYSVFPNFIPWAGYNPNIVYRFRPNGSDCHSSIMDVIILMRFAEGAEKPEPVPVHKLGADDPWQDAPELGALGYIFDQDMGNLPYVQKGLMSSRKGAISLANYQEARLRHLHRTLDGYLAD
ncbi:MAG: aromatic ring-hydroxylating dioxygenase subunit alpha [Gammaproteobacteria bacterium]|nr:MAG: aromatic ring-hydroxylating dioxygenase subunit alpha [Gammaproteobacteria bacterium]